MATNNPGPVAQEVFLRRMRHDQIAAHLRSKAKVWLAEFVLELRNAHDKLKGELAYEREQTQKLRDELNTSRNRVAELEQKLRRQEHASGGLLIALHAFIPHPETRAVQLL